MLMTMIVKRPLWRMSMLMLMIDVTYWRKVIFVGIKAVAFDMKVIAQLIVIYFYYQ